MLAQAELGNRKDATPVDRLEDYVALLPPGDGLRSEVLRAIAEKHSLLRGITLETARYKLLQSAAALDCYATQYHRVADDTGHKLQVSVGPEFVIIYDEQRNVISRQVGFGVQNFMIWFVNVMAIVLYYLDVVLVEIIFFSLLGRVSFFG